MSKKRPTKKRASPPHAKTKSRGKRRPAAKTTALGPRRAKLFAPVDARKLSPSFAALRKAPAGHPGRAMMEEIYAEFEDPDGNFLEQFQTTGFDSRFFELYLFAYLSRSGYTIEPRRANPDFIVARDGVRVAIEATTVNPATSGALGKVGKTIGDLTGPELLEYQQHELAIRFGSPLFSKLNKRCW